MRGKILRRRVAPMPESVKKGVLTNPGLRLVTMTPEPFVSAY